MSARRNRSAELRQNYITTDNQALEDPNRLEDTDARFEYGEERVQVIGIAHGQVLLVAVTLGSEDTCRIISARKATRHEEDRYYAGDRETR